MTTSADFEVVALIERELNKRWPETKIQPSLNRIAALCDALGSPQLSYPTIHIAGTNGKTTTARMSDALFRGLGYRTGRFTSPHLESFLNEFLSMAYQLLLRASFRLITMLRFILTSSIADKSMPFHFLKL